MRRIVVALACVVAAGCGHHSPDGANGDAGVIFDPCVPDPAPGYDPAAKGLAACCDDGPAHCVPSSEVLPALASNLSACPDGDSVCMPDPIIEAGGGYVPAPCTSSVGNAAGVCLSKCIPLVANNKQAAVLGQDGCGDGELCVPCKNPFDGTETGACSINDKLCHGDDGGTDDGGTVAQCPYTGPPILDPNSFDPCSPACGGAHCLPASSVPPAQQGLLDKCTAKGGVAGLCTPDKLIATGGNFVPKTCTSVAGSEGRCLSACLPSVAAEASELPQDVCDAGEKCAPCYNPTAADPSQPTGACSLACDKPAQPPVVLSCPWTGPPVVDPATFPACDGMCASAHCVPAANVPSSEQSLLQACTGGFCVPDPLISTGGNWVPKTCTSVAGAEGRCLSTCLPPIAAEADLLPQDVCQSGEKCAPCYNPTAQDPTAPTGACTLSCDKPTKPPVVLSCPWTGPNVVDPSSFPACSPACGGAHCIPSSLVPPAEQGLLAACPGGFCAPDPVIASDNNYVPPTCTSIAGAEGRCLSTCIPSVGAMAAQLPEDVCAAGTKCAPCYNPTASDPSAPTGACSLGCDKPAKPPVILTCPWTGPNVVDPNSFPGCSPACNGAHCVPASDVPPADQALLATCPGGYCAPDPIIATAGNYVPPTCNAFNGTVTEGRCMSTCIPAIANQSSELHQHTCDAGDLCAPCYDPFTGADTGACRTGCDKPANAPYKFPSCCTQATCVPTENIPSSEQSNLNQDSCPTQLLCVPNEMLPGGPGLQVCTGLLGAEGRCYSNCLNLGLGTIFPQRDCPADHTCVPCWAKSCN